MRLLYLSLEFTKAKEYLWMIPNLHVSDKLCANRTNPMQKLKISIELMIFAYSDSLNALKELWNLY